VAVPLTVIFLMTPADTEYPHIDAYTNTVTGWHLGMTGSVILPGFEEAAKPEHFRNIGWFRLSPRGPVAQYPPGAAALSAPLYRLWGEPMTIVEVVGVNNPDAGPIKLPIPPQAPARITAAVATAMALGFVAATVPYAGGSRFAGVVTGYVGGLATSMWAVASATLWQHGPGAMWVALGVLLAARSQLLWSGSAFGAAILTRPHLAIIAACVGIFMAVSDRDMRPAVKVGLGATAGLAGLVWFNWWVWGTPTITGGYGGGFTENLLEADGGAFLINVGRSLVDLEHGLLVYSPFLLVLAPGFRSAWRAAAPWVRGAAVGGTIYLLIQLKANRFSGGDGFTGYRYPLETLTAAGTFLFLAYLMWVQGKPVAKRFFWVCVLAGVVFQLT
jgi:hypothetical protein